MQFELTLANLKGSLGTIINCLTLNKTLNFGYTLMHVTQISCTFEYNHKMNANLSKIQDGSVNSPCTLSRVVLPD